VTNSDTNWKPTATTDVLERRARMLRRARAFFAARSIIEVETPVLTRNGVSDPHIVSLETRLAAREGRSCFLHTSPEYAMKRLLAAGTPDIFQICKVFRDHEIGSVHQPEFTMVEWYRLSATLNDMIEETCKFITEVSEAQGGAVDTFRYRDIFIDACQIDPLDTDAEHLADCAARMIDSVTPDLRRQIGADQDTWQNLLMSHVVVPDLAPERLSVIHHFPANQAALARFDPAEPELAERFEVFLNGIELANGYRELTDAAEQRRRFNTDMEKRRAAGLTIMEPDQALLAALESGLPDCSGVAIGFDRLVMSACGLKHIDQAVSFAL
jgi:lysyl-tRNA synthetase class 2